MSGMRLLGGHLMVMLDAAVDVPLHHVSEDTSAAFGSHVVDGDEFERQMEEGSGWLFYGHRFTDEHRRSQRLEAVYGRAPEGLDGVRLAVAPSLGLGVLTTWRSLPQVDSFDAALVAKREAADHHHQRELRRLVESWGLRWATVGRITSLLVVQVDSDDLSQVVATHAAEVGALLTGNMEDERPDLLAAHATDTNISGRRYERVYLRWTDALAVYDRTTDEASVASMRIARLVETGLLMRRLLSEAAFETETIAQNLDPWTLPWLSPTTTRVESLRQLLADAELTTSVAPPTHSIEGEHLLARAMDAFEIPRLLAIVNRSLAELDRRLEWRRLRWLAGAALIVFLTNTAIALFK